MPFACSALPPAVANWHDAPRNPTSLTLANGAQGINPDYDEIMSFSVKKKNDDGSDEEADDVNQDAIANKDAAAVSTAFERAPIKPNPQVHAAML